MSVTAAPPAPPRPAPPSAASPIPVEPASPTPRRPGPLHWIRVGISAAVLCFVLVVAALVIVIPAFGGATPYTIVSGSMQPTLPPGTLVVVKPTPAADIRVGDVITYQLKPGATEVVTHRVIEIQEPSTAGGELRFVTKGDAGELADPPVRAAQVRGVLWYSVPLLGWIDDVAGAGAAAVVVPVLATVLFVVAGSTLVGHVIDRRRRRTARAAAVAG